MSVTYRFDSKIVVIELADKYSMEDIPVTILHSLADSKCPGNPFILIDLSVSKSIFNRSTDDVIKMAHSLGSLAERFNRRIALVAPEDFSYGLMRMGSAFSAMVGFEPEVFRTYADARKWLLS